MTPEPRIRTFADFYPFYLSEHANRVSRRLHFVGISITQVMCSSYGPLPEEDNALSLARAALR